MIAAAMVLVSGSFAQKVEKVSRSTMDVKQAKSAYVVTNEPQTAVLAGTAGLKSPAKAPARNGMYYERPDGTYYVNFTFEGMGFYPTYFVAPAFKEQIIPYHFTPTKFAPKLKWELRYSEENIFDVTDWDVIDDSILVMEPLYPNQSIAMPTMIQGLNNWIIANDSRYSSANAAYFPRAVVWDEYTPMSDFHDHGGQFQYYGWGALDNHYLYGSGNVDEKYVNEKGDSVTSPCPVTAVFQEMGTSNGPLSIESAYVSFFSWTGSDGEPIPEGTDLTLTFYNPETNEEYGTMTTTLEDIVIEEDEDGSHFGYDTDYGKLWCYKTLFGNWQEDEFGGVFIEPITVDGPWAYRLSGLDQEGVDFGIGGCANYEEDTMADGYFVVVNKNVEPAVSHAYHYTSGISMHFVFNAMYDGVEVLEADSVGNDWVEELNIVKISDDGTTCSNKSGVEGLDGAIVYTVSPWYGYDEDLEGNMTVKTGEEEDAEATYAPVDELPEWITGVKANTSAWEEYYGQTEVTFTGEPLPADVAGRMAFVYLGARGAKAEAPIIVYQGDWEAAGVENIVNKVNASKVRYNLAGQRVDKNYKGLVIENGKKFFVK